MESADKAFEEYVALFLRHIICISKRIKEA